MNQHDELKPPNIVFIILDTFRANKFLENCNKLKLTPFIKKLLNNSIIFKNCVANSPWTYPSHCSMFTGLYHSQNLILSRDIFRLSNKVPILTEILKDCGYNTMCYTENVWISKRFGLTRGFNEVLRVGPIAEKENILNRFYQNLYFLEKSIKKRVKSKILLKIWYLTKIIIKRVIPHLIKRLFWKQILFQTKTLSNIEKFSQMVKSNQNNKPFYLFFNLMATHTPYIPPVNILKYFGVSIKDIKLVKEYFLNIRKSITMVNILSLKFTQRQIEIIERLYNACVFYADFLVKKIFTMLEKCDLMKNSNIIITSDHGEFLGGKLDHYLWEHGTHMSLNRSVIKIPLLFYNINFKKKVINEQVQLKDLFHTILHMTALPIDKIKDLEQDKSILYQIKTNTTPKYILGEYLKIKKEVLEIVNYYRKSIKKNIISKTLNDIYFLRTNQYKYIKYNNQIEELFDINTDPYEQNNIINRNKKLYQEMKSILQRILNQITNIENLTSKTTDKEKDDLKNTINSINFKGI